MIFITAGIVLLFTLVFGFWLSKSGKPYNGNLFNLHKLSALGAVVLAGYQAANVLRGMESGLAVVLLLVAAGLCILALFASGAMMSVGKLNYTMMLNAHRIASVLGVPAMAVLIYLLTGIIR